MATGQIKSGLQSHEIFSYLSKQVEEAGGTREPNVGVRAAAAGLKVAGGGAVRS